MKKIYGLLLLSFTLLVSCDDQLEPFTPGSLTEEVAITKSSDLTRLMNSGMNIMTNRAEYVFSSVFTDEAAMGFNNGGQGIRLEYVFLMLQDDPTASAIWSSSYGAMARFNRVIEFSSAVVATSAADQEVINRAKAEALVLRAACHLKIMSYFSPNPKDDSALAGVLADRIISTSEFPRRATNGQFYASIHADLDAAIAIYNTNTAPAYTNKTAYASKTLAQALKARAYALKGDYTNALTNANLVINTSGITLANSVTDYAAVFHTHNEGANKEVIFRLKRTAVQNSQGSNLHNGWCSVTNRRNGSPFYEVGRSLFNSYVPYSKSWSSNSAYSLNQFVDFGGRLYQVTTAGNSGSTGPTHTSGVVANGTAQLSFVNLTSTLYNSLAPYIRVWSANTAFVSNQLVDISGRLYRVTVAGTSGATAPTHTTGVSLNGTAELEYLCKGGGIDIRLATNVFTSGSATTSSLIDASYTTSADVKNTDILVLQKHGGQSALTSANGFNPDFMVCRLSEMYFIRAEAKVAAGDLTGAAADLKFILDARFTTPQPAPVFASAQAAWKGILDERRKELSFEGFRFIDLKRLGTLAGASLDRDPADYASASWNIPGANPTNLPLTSYKWALPIPQSELNANGGIQQNPGY